MTLSSLRVISSSAVRSALRTTSIRSQSTLPSRLPKSSVSLSLQQRSSFSTSSTLSASESEDSLPPGMDKLMNNPEALSAISNLMAKMQENGIDLKSGERPSMAELAKLAVKEDVREATAKVVEALQKAGIEISPEAMQQALGMEAEEGEGEGEKK